LNDDEAVMILKDCRGVPAVKKAADLLAANNVISPLTLKITNLLLEKKGAPDNALSLNPEITNIIIEYMHEIGYKRMAPEEAADKMMTELTAKLGQLKK
jgi:hypothetical protein